MAKISTYPQPTPPQLSDYVIGTDISDLLMTKNFVLSDMLNLFLPEITLQKVVNAGNTIVVPTTVSKGIDITLANQTSVFQNGISVTIPTQTGVYPTYSPAPDAFVANINGQTPGTLIGSVVGFLASAANDDNVAFFADLTATSGTSRGFETNSFDAHTGDYFIARKYVLGADSVVFKVANNGDTTAKSFIKTGGTSDQLLKADGSTSTLTNLVTTNTVQTITASKTFNGGLVFDAEQAAITMHNRYDMGQNIRITLYNTATDPEGLRVDNNNDNGTAIALNNNASGYGFYGSNNSTGVLMTLAASASSTGDLLRCFKNSAITTKVDTNGNITAPSFVKTGGTAAQYLMANGSTSTMPTLQEVTTAGSTTTASVIAVTSGKVLIGTTEAGQPLSGSNPQLVVTSPYTGISRGGVIDLRNLSPNIAPNELLGKIQFTGKDDISTGYTSSAIEGITGNFVGEGNPGGGILLFKTAANTTGASPIEKMRITQNGVVRPGNDNTSSLGESGNRWSSVWAANGTIQTSDEREKKDIVDSDLGLDFISKLRPVSFKWKVGKNEVTNELDGLDEEGNPKTKIVVTPIEGKRTHYGLIAQEVEAALDGKDFGGFIHDKDTDIKGLRYDQLIPVMINAVKELKAEIELLKSK